MINHNRKSTGPKTPAGKAISSRNAFKHGLASSQIIAEGEDFEAFESLLQGFEDDYRPDTMTEIVLVHDLAKFHWLKNRAIRYQQNAFINPEAIDFKHLDVMMRYQNSNHRSFINTLKMLEAIQKERIKRDREFVSEQEKLDVVMHFSGTPEYGVTHEIFETQDQNQANEPKILRFPPRPPGKLA